MKFAKKICASFLIVAVFFQAFLQVPVSAAYKVSFEVFSDTAFMINADTGTVIYEKNPDKKTYPASLTKIITAIVAIEQVKDLEGAVATAPSYIYDEFVGFNISNAGINRGEEVRMIDLLYALMLPSACEAGSIIADYVGKGNIQVFIDMMNEKAVEIGAVNTHFTNAHGLHNPEQVTTARDMVAIAKYAMSIPILEKICTSTTYTMPATNLHPQERVISNTNNLMSKSRGGERYYYQYVRGVKTGSIDEVGRNLVSTATKNGYTYILCTLGAPVTDPQGVRFSPGTNKSFDDAIALYSWAFNSFTTQKVLKENDVIDEVPVKLGADRDYVSLISSKDVSALLPVDVQKSAIQRSVTLAKDVVAPVKKGTILGRMELKLLNEVIETVDLVAATNVDRNNVLYALMLAKEFLLKPQVIALLIILTLLIFLYVAFSLRYKKLKRNRNARLRNRI